MGLSRCHFLSGKAARAGRGVPAPFQVADGALVLELCTGLAEPSFTLGWLLVPVTRCCTAGRAVAADGAGNVEAFLWK